MAKASQNTSLLKQVIPVPTGMNGYEDYLQAADIVHSAQFQAFKKWDQATTKGSNAGHAPAGLDSNSTPLQRKRYEVLNFGRALKFIDSGNSKPTSRGTQLLFVEFSEFNDLTKLGIDAAYIAYADGNWATGTKTLLALLTFGDNVSRECAIGLIVGGNVMSKTFAALDSHKAQWSVEDCSQISNIATKFLSAEPSVAAALTREEQFILANIDSRIDGNKPIVEDDPGDKGAMALADRLAKLSARDRYQLKITLSTRLRKQFEDYHARLQQPELKWINQNADGPQLKGNTRLDSLDDVAGAIQQAIMPFDESILMAARIRTQVRLLRLNALVQAFKWQNGRLPNVLEEFAKPKFKLDPLTSEQFHYEIEESGYRLYSQGAPGMGPIELKSRPLPPGQNSGYNDPMSR